MKASVRPEAQQPEEIGLYPVEGEEPEVEERPEKRQRVEGEEGQQGAAEGEEPGEDEEEEMLRKSGVFEEEGGISAIAWVCVKPLKWNSSGNRARHSLHLRHASNFSMNSFPPVLGDNVVWRRCAKSSGSCKTLLSRNPFAATANFRSSRPCVWPARP